VRCWYGLRSGCVCIDDTAFETKEAWADTLRDNRNIGTPVVGRNTMPISGRWIGFCATYGRHRATMIRGVTEYNAHQGTWDTGQHRVAWPSKGS
jgi:hypothetical protein